MIITTTPDLNDSAYTGTETILFHFHSR